MCEISVVNLHNGLLNEKLWLLLGSIGSPKHPDGWGMANSKGENYKCAVPMFYTTNSGELMNGMGQDDSPLLGHIRNASPAVPVTTANAHPFVLENVVFVHNGKLTPKDEKAFVLEEKVADIDNTTRKQAVNAKGELLWKTVKRSDSLIFFEEFIKDWKAAGNDFDTQDSKFVNILNITMGKFYGPFAFVFIINGTFYIVRGKSKTLHISYLRGDKEKKQGWAVNTNKETLDAAVVLMGNLSVLDGDGPMKYTYPVLLKDEAIYIAEDTDLKEIGTIKENYAPVTYVHHTPALPGNSANTATNFTKTGGTEDELTKIARKIFSFMDEYSLSPQDMCILMYLSFGFSTLEVNVSILTAFYEDVLLNLGSLVKKQVRKKVRKTTTAHVSIFEYGNLQYPWMINTKAEQLKFIK